MATYFHGGPEIQPVDGLQTLYLMNPSYVGYSDATGPQAGQQQPNMVFLNSPLSSLNSIPQSQQQHQHQHHQQQHFVGIPLQPTQQPTAQYNIWAPTPVDVQAHSGPIRPAGLSLSLQSTEEAKIAAGPSTNGLQSVLMGSKYLKAAQQLLDEVASVGKDGRSEAAAGMARKGDEKCGVKGGKDLEGEGGEGKRGAELSTAERQELQMKKAKLVNMLDEVEQRYRQYHHQMQIVVSSFESVAGFGSARTYTSLALQTISKQFRCLRDAITGQIRGTSKSLGEEDCVGAGGSKSVGSRLRFVDHHLRQQRALQQLGMIQHNAWRPQRGLPERAVSVLRAWLFEHFLHP